MVAEVRCKEIADKISSSFENKDCPDLLNDVKSGQVKHFGKSLDLILNDRLSEYDNKTEYYDEGVKTKKRSELHDKMMKLAKPVCATMLKDIQSEILNEFIKKSPQVVKGKQPLDEQALLDHIKPFITKFVQKCQGIAQLFIVV
ncbi:hypothetical protein LguiA_017916 [Lonicera macranthoides]